MVKYDLFNLHCFFILGLKDASNSTKFNPPKVDTRLSSSTPQIPSAINFFKVVI